MDSYGKYVSICGKNQSSKKDLAGRKSGGNDHIPRFGSGASENVGNWRAASQSLHHPVKHKDGLNHVIVGISLSEGSFLSGVLVLLFGPHLGAGSACNRLKKPTSEVAHG
jgi:hypothetical protein